MELEAGWDNERDIVSIKRDVLSKKYASPILVAVPHSVLRHVSDSEV